MKGWLAGLALVVSLSVVGGLAGCVSKPLVQIDGSNLTTGSRSSSSSEVQRLQAENRRLREENSQLRERAAELEKELREARGESPKRE